MSVENSFESKWGCSQMEVILPVYNWRFRRTSCDPRSLLTVSLRSPVFVYVISFTRCKSIASAFHSPFLSILLRRICIGSWTTSLRLGVRVVTNRSLSTSPSTFKFNPLPFVLNSSRTHFLLHIFIALWCSFESVACTRKADIEIFISRYKVKW